MPSEQSDEQLLAAFVAGRRAALGELAQRYERSLLGLATGLLGGRRDLACDAVQETWLRVIRFAEKFGGRSRFKTWVYRIAVNQCGTLRANGVLTVKTEVEKAAATTPARGPGPERTAAAADQTQMVRQAVERLPVDRRLVILLCYHSGLTHEQAAEILEIPLGTLKSRLHAALAELRASLSAEANHG